MENNLVVRCSELHKIMTKSKTKSSPISQGTKTYIMQKAKEFYFGIKPTFSSKYTDKGNEMEDTGIEMVNQVRFMDFRKNTERKDIGWLTGECDINGDERIIDIKCSWSIDTFPCFLEEAEAGVKKSGYDWQVRGYMMLYNKPFAEVIYCLTSTPIELLGYNDDAELHNVEHIDIEDRMTSVKVDRCLDKENEIKEQYEKANAYYKECLAELKQKHQKQEQWS